MTISTKKQSDQAMPDMCLLEYLLRLQLLVTRLCIRIRIVLASTQNLKEMTCSVKVKRYQNITT